LELWKNIWLFWVLRRLLCFMRVLEVRLRIGKILCRELVRVWRWFYKCKDNGFIWKLFSIVRVRVIMTKRNNWWEILINLKKLRKGSRKLCMKFTLILMLKFNSEKKDFLKNLLIWAENLTSLKKSWINFLTETEKNSLVSSSSPMTIFSKFSETPKTPKKSTNTSKSVSKESTGKHSIVFTF
jgi:hypothetical protein